MAAVNVEACKRIKKDMETGKPLTFSMVGEVFGQPFWELLVMSLLDAQDAARAIAGAIARLKGGEVVN